MHSGDYSKYGRVVLSEWLFKLNGREIQAKFQRKWGDDRVRGTQGQSVDRLEWEWIRDYLAGCLGGFDEANRKKE